MSWFPLCYFVMYFVDTSAIGIPLEVVKKINHKGYTHEVMPLAKGLHKVPPSLWINQVRVYLGQDSVYKD